MTTRVKLISRGVDEVLNSSGTMSILRGKAESVLAAAQSSAPIDTGAYADSLQVVEDHTDRAVARVATTVSYGLIVESNTGNLARALDAAG